MKFAHEKIVLKEKGRYKLYCRCGQLQTPKIDEAEVEEAYRAHLVLSGIRERKTIVREGAFA